MNIFTWNHFVVIIRRMHYALAGLQNVWGKSFACENLWVVTPPSLCVNLWTMVRVVCFPCAVEPVRCMYRASALLQLGFILGSVLRHIIPASYDSIYRSGMGIGHLVTYAVSYRFEKPTPLDFSTLLVWNLNDGVMGMSTSTTLDFV